MATHYCKKYKREIEDVEKDNDFCDEECFFKGRGGYEYMCPDYKNVPDPIPIERQMDKELHEIAYAWSHYSEYLRLEPMFNDLMSDFREDDGTDWHPIEEIEMDNIAFINSAIQQIEVKLQRVQQEANSYIKPLNKIKERLQKESEQ